jgi:hypothetical protein
MVVSFLPSHAVLFAACIKRHDASKGEIQRQEWAAEG